MSRITRRSFLGTALAGTAGSMLPGQEPAGHEALETERGSHQADAVVVASAAAVE